MVCVCLSKQGIHLTQRGRTPRHAQAKKHLSSNKKLLAFQGPKRRFNLTINARVAREFLAALSGQQADLVEPSPEEIRHPVSAQLMEKVAK